jgi:protocatechuate 3,4-dioxygenase, beta subunit
MRLLLMCCTLVLTLFAFGKGQSVTMIAPLTEPGERIVVHGKVIDAATKKPVAGVTVYAYHTDATGVYNRRGVREPRLKGWVTSDANGKFELRTIRPGRYPGASEPAHIHFEYSGAGYPKQWDALEFRDGDRSKEAKITLRLKR